uniref:Uncharacterized protein n=1 Tax=Physcomitrium patens TaxID=3218 RepID=A0A2K1II79_PHYPA|nr:hypothetical protein PHYPA_027675 [Physcomitrium patens]
MGQRCGADVQLGVFESPSAVRVKTSLDLLRDEPTFTDRTSKRDVPRLLIPI